VTVRLATYNLLHGMSVLGGMPAPARDGQGRVVGPPTVDDDGPLRDAVERLDVDVIGLQEVDVHQPRSNYAHLVRAVADAMDAEHWRFAPAVVGTPGEPGWSAADPTLDHVSHPDTPQVPSVLRPGDDLPHDTDYEVRRMGPLYGVGLVSRLPVLEWRTTRFDPAPWSLPLMIPAEPRPRFMRVADEPRAAIVAVVQGAHGPFTVATAHLSFVPGYNVRQLRSLRTYLAGLPRPLIVLGDFNLPGSLPARITGWTPLLRQATYPSMRPRVQLDHVLADGLTAHQQATARTEVHLLPVSDHAAVTIDLDL
jgi:endonuclease/exonuclease/phosphatase family metal-dependent hydrolase